MHEYFRNAVDETFLPRRSNIFISKNQDGQEGVDGAEKNIGQIIGLDIVAEKSILLAFLDIMSWQREKSLLNFSFPFESA